MIPKVIHYCWFGGKKLPENVQKCINSWKRYCPDYTIKVWNENNFDLNCCDFVKEAYSAKEWAFVSDFARLYIVYNEGGIYLDTDVELLNNLDSFLGDKCFLAEETNGYVNTGLGFGAEKNNPVVYDMLKEYLEEKFFLQDGSYNMEPCPRKNTMPLLKIGYEYSGRNIWENDNVTVYPPEYFCPLDYGTKKIKKTRKTVAMHLYNASWHSKLDDVINNIQDCDRSKHPVEYKIKKLFIFPISIINKIQRIGFFNTIRFIRNKLFKS